MDTYCAEDANFEKKQKIRLFLIIHLGSLQPIFLIGVWWNSSVLLWHGFPGRNQSKFEISINTELNVIKSSIAVLTSPCFKSSTEQFFIMSAKNLNSYFSNGSRVLQNDRKYQNPIRWQTGWCLNYQLKSMLNITEKRSFLKLFFSKLLLCKRSRQKF